jgi:hypothetical protein
MDLNLCLLSSWDSRRPETPVLVRCQQDPNLLNIVCALCLWKKFPQPALALQRGQPQTVVTVLLKTISTLGWLMLYMEQLILTPCPSKLGVAQTQPLPARSQQCLPYSITTYRPGKMTKKGPPEGMTSLSANNGKMSFF